jgi:hypothetical protein
MKNGDAALSGFRISAFLLDLIGNKKDFEGRLPSWQVYRVSGSMWEMPELANHLISF